MSNFDLSFHRFKSSGAQDPFLEPSSLSQWFPGGGVRRTHHPTQQAGPTRSRFGCRPPWRARTGPSTHHRATYKIPPPPLQTLQSLVASRRHDHEQVVRSSRFIVVVVAFFFIVSDRRSGRKPREELANLDQLEGGAASEQGLETEEQRNKFLVLRLYEALNSRDHAAVHGLLAPDLEWWFHGPPAHQHMMRVLTGGASPSPSFRFQPRTVDAFGSTVIAEGTDGDAKAAYWVHAWTVGADGVITQLREYFNTDLTVTRLAAAAASKCVWQSRRPDRQKNSLPGLVLAL